MKRLLVAAMVSLTMFSFAHADEPLKGFFYSLKQSSAIGTLGFKADGDKNKLGGRDTISFDLDKSEASGFYQMIVTPVPVK